MEADNTEGRIIRPLRHNGERYNGINVLLLWSSALEQGFSNPEWMTFRQANELGAHVRKGEHGKDDKWQNDAGSYSEYDVVELIVAASRVKSEMKKLRRAAKKAEGSDSEMTEERQF